jgi:hypothetical protein
MHFVNQDQTLARREIAEAWAVKKNSYDFKHLTFKKLGQTLAASSTPIVVRFLCSVLNEPTEALAYRSRPHILRHSSTLNRSVRDDHVKGNRLTKPPSPKEEQISVVAISQKREALHELWR